MSRAKPIVKKWARKLNKRVRTKLRSQREERFETVLLAIAKSIAGNK